MPKVENKGKSALHDQSDLMGQKPFGNIGEDRTAEEVKNIRKVKKKAKEKFLRAKGSSFQSGEQANAGGSSSAISSFVNRK